MSSQTTLWQLIPFIGAPEAPWQGDWKIERHDLPDWPGSSEEWVGPLAEGCLFILGSERPSAGGDLSSGAAEALFDETIFRGCLEVLAYLYRLFQFWGERWGDDELLTHPFVTKLPEIFALVGQWLAAQRGVLSPSRAARLREALEAVVRGTGMPVTSVASAAREDEGAPLDDTQPF
jgi:hypothetical protein